MSQSAKATKQQERQETITKLREYLPPGAKVYTVLRRVSRSGMQREISIVIPGREDVAQWHTNLAAKVLECRVGKTGGIVMGGCGMDMGASLVMQLAYYLYPQGFGCIGIDQKDHSYCPSNDHSNGDRDYTPNVDYILPFLEKVAPHLPVEDGWESTFIPKEYPRHWHNSGDYALRHAWI